MTKSDEVAEGILQALRVVLIGSVIGSLIVRHPTIIAFAIAAFIVFLAVRASLSVIAKVLSQIPPSVFNAIGFVISALYAALYVLFMLLVFSSAPILAAIGSGTLFVLLAFALISQRWKRSQERDPGAREVASYRTRFLTWGLLIGTALVTIIELMRVR
jgi:hypothetical protein